MPFGIHVNLSSEGNYMLVPVYKLCLYWSTLTEKEYQYI